jgi:hypothetical protein
MERSSRSLPASPVHRFEFPLHHLVEVVESRRSTLTSSQSECLFVLCLRASKRSFVSRDEANPTADRLPDAAFWTRFKQVFTHFTKLLHFLLFRCFDETQTIRFLEQGLGPEAMFDACAKGIVWLQIDTSQTSGLMHASDRDALIIPSAELAGLMMAYIPQLRSKQLHEQYRILVDFYTPRAGIPNELIWFKFRRLILHLWEREHCAAPGCRLTSVDCGHLTYCGGCGILRYCSRQCQRRAWRHVAAPHRMVCSTLRDIIDKLGLRGANRVDALGSLREPLGPFQSCISLAKPLLAHEQARTLWEMESCRNCKSYMASE